MPLAVVNREPQPEESRPLEHEPARPGGTPVEQRLNRGAHQLGGPAVPAEVAERDPELVGPASRAADAIDRGDQLCTGTLGEPAA
jgi:hypothetical protein